MKDMLSFMGLELSGHHHSGLDDCKNIAKIVKQLLKEGCHFYETATTEGMIEK